MEKDINEILSQYKKMYAASMCRRATPRFPFTLTNEEDLRLRLTATYSFEVEQRGATFKFDDNTIDKIGRVARWIYSSSKRGLVLMGSLGNGKSTMLKAMRDVFFPYSKMGDAQEIYDYYKREQGVMYWDEKILLVDDLGVEPVRCLNYGEEYHPITRLLLHRYNQQMTTMIATNLGLDEIQDRYGDRVVDRMFETFEVIKYDRDSYRREQV